MQLFNVFTKKLINTGTEEKLLWFKAGTIKQTENGGTFLTLFHIPDQDFYIYPDKAKEKETPDIQLEETADTDQAYATE
ncbi:MAG: hypothetical protein ACK5UE_08805 [Chitinophagales bacterium]|jgi:hypothetical protein|nr:hypothetical protein [Sphingobacteriales bacterium]